MTDKIEPVLSAEEWEGLRKRGGVLYPPLDDITALDDSDLPKAIALANAALPDSDPRKITREKIAAMREAALTVRADYRLGKPGREAELAEVNGLIAFADALESYLPPEG